MKRIIIYVLLIILNIFLGITGMNHKILEYPSDSIIGVTYYKYNTKEDKYDSLVVNKDTISYSGNEFDLSRCSKYEFTKSTDTVKMDCGKTFRLIVPNNNLVVVSIEGKNYYFYKNMEDSYVKEFSTQFDMTMSDYEFEGEEKIQKITIDKEEFEELLNSENISYVYVKNNACDFKCTIFSGLVDKLNISDSLHYYKFSNLDNETLNDINLLDSTFRTSDSPKVLVIGNGSVQKVLTPNIIGFTMQSSGEIMINE